jgi:hypothetical protein
MMPLQEDESVRLHAELERARKAYEESKAERNRLVREGLPEQKEALRIAVNATRKNAIAYARVLSQFSLFRLHGKTAAGNKP